MLPHVPTIQGSITLSLLFIPPDLKHQILVILADHLRSVILSMDPAAVRPPPAVGDPRLRSPTASAPIRGQTCKSGSPALIEPAAGRIVVEETLAQATVVIQTPLKGAPQIRGIHLPSRTIERDEDDALAVPFHGELGNLVVP